MTKPEDSKQAIPSPEDRVRAEILEKARRYCYPRVIEWQRDEADPEDRRSTREMCADVAAAFALSQIEELQRKVVCSFCGTVTEYDHSKENAQLDAILAHINVCEQSPVRQLIDALSLVEELRGQVAAKEKERGQWQALFMESEEYNCSCNIADTTKPVGDPMNYVCDWHERHPDITKARNETFPLVWRAETAEAELVLLRKRKDYHAEYVEAVEAAEKAERELAIEKTMLPKWEGLLDVHERLSESLVRQLEVMREALRKIEDPGAKVDSLMEARMIARSALTPEPATKAEVKK